MLPRVLAKNFDKAITDQVEAAYKEHGVTLALGEKVMSFEDNGDSVTVVTDKGPTLQIMQFWALASASY